MWLTQRNVPREMARHNTEKLWTLSYGPARRFKQLPLDLSTSSPHHRAIPSDKFGALMCFCVLYSLAKMHMGKDPLSKKPLWRSLHSRPGVLFEGRPKVALAWQQVCRKHTSMSIKFPESLYVPDSLCEIQCILTSSGNLQYHVCLAHLRCT